MAVIGALLLLVALLGLFLGLIKPSLVLWWGANKTRAKVLLTYGLLLVTGIGFAAIGAPSDLEAGKTALAGKNYKEAVTWLEAVKPSDPDYSEAQRLLPDAQKKLLMSKLDAAEAASLAGEHAKVVALLADYPSGAAGSIDAMKILEESKQALADAERERSAQEEQKQADKANREAEESPKENETEGGRLEAIVSNLESLATDSDWDFSRKNSPFDGAIFQAQKIFESDEYAAQISVQLKCVPSKKSLTLSFISHVVDANGDALPSSAFKDTIELGPFSAATGRVKWANRKTANFSVMLTDNSNEAVMRSQDILDAANLPNSSPGEAMRALLPANFGLSNGAGEITISIPRDNSNIQKVLNPCS